MTIIDSRVNEIDALTLDRGAHDSFDNGACVMEAVAYVSGEPWSDHPACASPVIGAFMRPWNDSLNDEDRNRMLKPYVPLLVGTKGTLAQEGARAWMCLDWLVRTYTPAWLRLAGLTDQALRLKGLSEFKAGMDVPSICPTIDAVCKDATAAWAAPGNAAWAAAGDAARATARDAAWEAAWDAARDAGWAAAGNVAWAATGAAAGNVARARLKPTVKGLQTTALLLIDRMIAA